MKRVSSLLFTLLVCISFVFAQTDPKKEKLISLVNEDGLVRLNANTFDRFAEGKRNYGMVVLLTALGSQFKCHPCR